MAQAESPAALGAGREGKGERELPVWLTVFCILFVLSVYIKEGDDG